MIKYDLTIPFGEVSLIQHSTMPQNITMAILDAYEKLNDGTEPISVAVRSSATAEDLPTASFAGQHDSFLNVKGEEQLISAVQACFTSLFTNRAIKYREDNKFDQMSAGLSVGGWCDLIWLAPALVGFLSAS